MMKEGAGLKGDQFMRSTNRYTATGDCSEAEP